MPRPALLLPAFALAMLVVSGCPRRIPTLDPAAQITDAEELIKAVAQSGQKLTALRATGSVIMRTGSKRLKAHTVVLVRRPAKLRFETESFFDQPLSILITDGMRFSLWDMQEGRFLSGRATPDNISRVIPIPMDGPEVVGIIMGDPPLIAYAQSALRWDPDQGQYHLTLSNSRQTQQIWIHPERLRPVKIVCEQEGKLLYRLQYQEWQGGKQDPHFPTKIRFEMPARDIQLRLRLREVERNVELSKELFELTPPPGLSVEIID